MEKKKATNKFGVGEKVMLSGREVLVEAMSRNVNGVPVYKIGGRWHREVELEKWYPQCPV